MNFKNFPKKLDSKTSNLRIKVPENLDLALEGLIRKVLREQPATDDIYAFAANFFETLLCLRDKSGKKEKLNEINQKLNEQEQNEMTILANSFPHPSPNKFTYSAVNNKEKRKKSSSAKLQKQNSFEERENIKENNKLKSLSRKKLGDIGKKKSNDTITSDLLKPPALGTEQVLTSLDVKDNIQKNNETVIQNEADVEVEAEKEKNVNVEENEEFLASDPIRELVNQELLEKASEISKTDKKLSETQQHETIKNEVKNTLKQVEDLDTVTENELTDKNNLNEKINFEDLKKDENEAIEIMKEKTKEDTVEKEITDQNHQNILLESENEKIIKDDEKDTEETVTILSQLPNNFEEPEINKEKEILNVENDSKILQNLKNYENFESEKIDLHLKSEEENGQQAIDDKSKLIQEEIDLRKEQEVTNNNEIDNKVLNEKLSETDSKSVNANDNIEFKKEKVFTESNNTAEIDAEDFNNLKEFKTKKDKNLNKSIDRILKSGKTEENSHLKEKENEVTHESELENLKETESNIIEKDTKEVTNVKLEDLSKTTNEKNSEADIFKEKNSIKANIESNTDNMEKQIENKNRKMEIEKGEEEIHEIEKLNMNLEATENKENNLIQTDNSKELEISNENEKDNIENKKEKCIEKNESIEGKFVEFQKEKKNDSENVKKNDEKKDAYNIIDTNSNTQKLRITSSEDKNLENNVLDDTENKKSVDIETPIEKFNHAISPNEAQLDKTDDIEKKDDSKEEENILKNEADSLATLPSKNSFENINENKEEINEITDISEDEAKTSFSPFDRAENEKSIADEQNNENKVCETAETKPLNFQESDSKNQIKILKSLKNTENTNIVNVEEDLKNVNNEDSKKTETKENLEVAQEDSEILQVNQAVKTDNNDLEEKKYLLQEEAEKSEHIINSQKVLETSVTEIKTDKEKSGEDSMDENKAEIEKKTTEEIETLFTEENKTTIVESEIKTDEQSSNQVEKTRIKRSPTINSDIEVIYDGDKPKLLEEASIKSNENDSSEKYKDEKNEEKTEIDLESDIFPEELCSVVDTDEIRRIQEKEISIKEDKILVTPVEEKSNGTEATSLQEESMPLKTVRTHYYDFLQVPETNIKEYIVKPLKEVTTSLFPSKTTHSVIRTYQFDKEILGQDLWTLKENTSPFFTEKNENEYDNQNLETDELLTPSSVTSMAVSETNMFSLNEVFLENERLHSSFEKNYQLSSRTEVKINQIENDDREKVKREIVEKKIIRKVDAQPMPPRDSSEIVEEDSEELENLKISKEKPQKKESSPSKRNFRKLKSEKSSDSENFAFVSVDIETVIGTQKIDDDNDDENEEFQHKIFAEVSSVEVEIETTIGVVQERTDQKDGRKILGQELQTTRKIDNKELLLTGSEQIDLDQSSLETTDTTSSSALTQIKAFDSSKKNFTRSSTQSLLISQSLDKSMKIGVSEDFVKKKNIVKTKSLNSLREENIDKEIWKKIENELEEAATKIQSRFRSYRKKKKLQRGDAIQITSESSRSITPVEPSEVQHQQASGEFHDSIVLSVIPR